MHRSTYRKRENLIQNPNQRAPSIIEYQAGRTTYMMMEILYWKIMRRPIPVNGN
jgi:hypothetical protein